MNDLAEIAGSTSTDDYAFLGELYLEDYAEPTSTTYLHFRGGTARTCILALASSAFGSGLFTIPYGFKSAGLLFGLLMLAFAAYIGYISTYILLKSTKQHKFDSYSSLVTSYTTPLLGYTVDIVICLNGIFSGMTFFIFLTDFILDLLRSHVDNFTITIFGHEWQRPLIILICAAVTMPLSLQKTYARLKKFTLAYVGSILLTTFIVVIKTPVYYKRALIDAHQTSIQWWKWDQTTLQSFNIFIYGFMQHQNVIAISQDMTDNTLGQCKAIASGAILIESFVYMILATFGYLSFQRRTAQNFINNYPSSDAMMAFCRVILSLCLLFCIPMGMISTGQSLRKVYRITLRKCASLSRWIRGLRNSPQLMSLTVYLNQPSFQREAIPLDGHPRFASKKARTISILLAYTIEMIGAVLITEVATAISFVGGILSVYLMTFIPSFILYQLPGRSIDINNRHFKLVLLVGTTLTCLALSSAILFL